MCGIYGVVNQRGKLKEYIDNLQKLEHRGPDNQSYFSNKEIFLGHVRLSILDLESHSNQPFENDESVLIYNGEIYNYLELKSKYLSDRVFITDSDTEVLFYLLEMFGESIICELNGMFAFGFFNKKTKKLLLSRDRTGIKPLYYSDNENSFEFCSEIKSLQYQVDLNKIKQFISLRSYQNGYLPFSNIQEFPAGHYAILYIDKLNLEFFEFKKLDKIPSKNIYRENMNISLASSVRQLDSLLHESISLHLRSDAKIGSLCSGGVDSSLISAIASSIEPGIDLYHAGVEGYGGEEKFAEQVSKHLKKDINYIKVSSDTYWTIFPYLTYISDLPIYHPNDVSLHYIAQKASEDNIKVLLSGEGADELFGGYSWHQNLIRRNKLFAFYDKHPLLNKILNKLMFQITKNGLNGMVSGSYRDFMPLGLGYSDRNVEIAAKNTAFVSNDFSNWKQWQNHLKIYDGFDSHDRNFALSLMFNNLYGHLGSILHRTDRILMANSIEGRVPFLENDLIDFALNQPFNNKIYKKEGKYILKKMSERYLPRSVIYRPKAGFPVPWGRYIEKIEKIFEHGFILELTGLSLNEIKSYFENDVNLKFSLIALEVWGRIFVRNESYESIIVE